jgi:hypothetical protein
MRAKGGGFTRENQTVSKYDQFKPVKTQTKEGDENENQTKDSYHFFSNYQPDAYDIIFSPGS